MQGNALDEFIAEFEHLHSEVRWTSNDIGTIMQFQCYAQALGVVVVGSLSVELSGRIKTCNGCPSCCATQGQNHGIRRGCRDSGKSGNRPEDLRIHRKGESVVRGFRHNSLVLVQKIKPRA